jgi:microcystin-dependent protein
VFDTLAHLNGQMIAFTPHATNGATVTLNVDSLGAKPLRTSPGAELPAGTIIQGTPYVAIYNGLDATFYLRGFYGNPYNIPLGGGLPFFGSTAPNSSFVFPFGQAISRSAYFTLFSLLSTTYGVGDGSTTFNVPDLRGRVPAGADAMGGSSASRLTTTSGMTGTGIGSTGGAQTHTLTVAQIPASIPVTVTGTASVTSTVANVITSNNVLSSNAAGGSNNQLQPPTALGSIASTGTISGTGTASGSGTAHPIVQPTLVCNYIIRII